MYTDTEVAEWAQAIAKEFDPHRIILFGSHADGSANSDSDVDLMVIMPFKGKSSKMALKIRQSLKKNFPLDLVVKDPTTANRRIIQGDSFLENAFRKGKVLYERTES